MCTHLANPPTPDFSWSNLYLEEIFGDIPSSPPNPTTGRYTKTIAPVPKQRREPIVSALADRKVFWGGEVGPLGDFVETLDSSACPIQLMDFMLSKEAFATFAVGKGPEVPKGFPQSSGWKIKRAEEWIRGNYPRIYQLLSNLAADEQVSGLSLVIKDVTCGTLEEQPEELDENLTDMLVRLYIFADEYPDEVGVALLYISRWGLPQLFFFLSTDEGMSCRATYDAPR